MNFRIFTAIVLVSSLLGLSSPAFAKPVIVGSWQTVVTVTDPPGFDQFTGLDSYLRDGTAIASNAPDGANSTGHGVWKRLKGFKENDFAETVLFSVVDPSVFPPGAAFVKVRGEMKVESKNEMTGPFIVEFLDADFNVLFSASGTRLHTRIRFEPMP